MLTCPLSNRASAITGTKVIEMNSTLLTVTEEENKKGLEMDKSDAKETAVDVPNENMATTSTKSAKLYINDKKQKTVQFCTSSPKLL